ncbi:MAG: AbrB/MazE/SpoVT family DNA-binding domain-containing protein [Deltaproteobacteria bacterium]|jgi:AbrB family looped-hinge helix DNA binding protein
MSKVTAKYQVIVPVEVRKEMGIIPGSEVAITKKGDKFVLIGNQIEIVKRKWCGRFKGGLVWWKVGY